MCLAGCWRERSCVSVPPSLAVDSPIPLLGVPSLCVRASARRCACLACAFAVPVSWRPQLYSFLVRRTDSKFNKVVLKRLCMSKANRVPMGVARVARYMAGKTDKLAVFVGTITDDVRLEGRKLPALNIVALRVTEGARARITAAGGNVYTFDQLAMMRPTGANTVLLRGRRTARTVNRYFGTPGSSGASVRPRVRSKGRKFEKARGRRKSRGYKC